jgi:acyl-CoA thioesterase-2
MSTAVAELLAFLDLEAIERDIFRGDSPREGWKRIFGGLVVAQALVAAGRTVEAKVPHSLHAYFMLPGDPARPIVYEVDRIRDGRSFATRRCNAVQHGRAIFSLSASFQIEEPGLEHAFAMPAVPDPDNLPAEAAYLARHAAAMPDPARRFFARARPIEFRPVEIAAASRVPGTLLPRPRHLWLRIRDRLPDDPAVHRAMLAYASDATLLETAVIQHGRSIFDPGLQAASIDHALWFHRGFRADEWLLYAQDSPTAVGARGLARGSIFSRDGRLVASVAQEGLMRERTRQD